jgi:D-beta-D-heptose 7-phosphate kinase/D-beta-D-heptose 1-phosphate adenosyltransferase
VKIAITSGYFDPLHRGHLELLRLARAQADALWVIVNSDAQAALKKGAACIDQDTRLAVVAALRDVDRAVLAVDADGSVVVTLGRLIAEARSFGHEPVFCKGGDRHSGNIPESGLLLREKVALVDGLGAKIDSSSRLVGRRPPPVS